MRKNNTPTDFNDKKIDNVRFVKVNSMLAVREHLTPKYYVDHAISHSVHESTLLRLEPDEKVKLHEQDSIILNSILTSPKTILELPTESYVESLHEVDRNRRDSSSVFDDEHNEFDNNKLTNLDSVSVKKNPSSDNQLANKKYVDDSLGEGNNLRFNQTLQNYPKVSVGNDTYNLTKCDIF